MPRSRRAPNEVLVLAMRSMRGAHRLAVFAALLIALAPALAGLHCLLEPHVWCETHASLEHGEDHRGPHPHQDDDSDHDSELPHHDPCEVLALARLDATQPSLASLDATKPIGVVSTVVAPAPLAPSATIPLLRLAPKTPPPTR